MSSASTFLLLLTPTQSDTPQFEDILTSDTFNRSDGPMDETFTDAGMGGDPLEWSDEVGEFSISNNAAQATSLGSGDWAAVLVDSGETDVLVSCDVYLNLG